MELSEKAKQLGNEPANYTQTFDSYSGKLNGFSKGLTKRECFAGLAMQSLLTADISISILPEITDIAKHACIYADALLEELAKE